MKKNHSAIKRLLSVLLITTMLISPAFLSPFKANALEQVLPNSPSSWPGGIKEAALGDNDTLDSSNYARVIITAEEYPGIEDLQVYDDNGLKQSLLKILQIPESYGVQPEDYNLTLHIYNPKDGVDIVLPTLNYYLPVKQTITAIDGRTCDIFIIAIPELRNYSETYNISDYLDAGSLFKEKYLEMSELYWNMYDEHDFPAVSGGPHPMARRALLAFAYGLHTFIMPQNLEQGERYPFGSEMKEEALARWLLSRGCFTPSQASSIFGTVCSYYIEYVKESIVTPNLISVSSYGSISEEQDDGSFVLYFPAGLDMKKIQRTAVFKTKESAPVDIEITGGWKLNGISFVTLYARDPATIHVYNNEAEGIIKDDNIIRIMEGTPLFGLMDFGAYGRNGRIDDASAVVSLHLPDGASWVFNPDTDFVGSDVIYLDSEGTEIYPDENGEINFSVVNRLVVINDFTDYMTDPSAEPIIFTKEYTLDITQGNSSECDLLNFSLGVEGEYIEMNGDIITVYIPFGTDWSLLNSQYTASYDATVVALNGEYFESSESEPVIYRVTAQNGNDYKDYYLTVIEMPASGNNFITSFEYGSVAATIDNNSNTIMLELPAGSSTIFAPVIKVSEYATIVPSSGIVQDFTNPVIYTVKAQDGGERVYTVNVSVSTQIADNPRKGELTGILNAIINVYRSSADDDWEWLNLGVYEKRLENNDNEFDLAKQVRDLDVGLEARVTDIDRLIMMLTARGFDCTNLAKYNNGEPLTDAVGNRIDNLVANLYNTNGRLEGALVVNSRIFALIALDIGNYTIPENAAVTREHLLETLIEHEYLSDGYGVDMVGMLMYAIAPYQNDPVYGDLVKAKLDEGISLLLKKMKYGYNFESFGAQNSEAVSQVIAALASCGIDCYSDPRFSSGNMSVLSSWLDNYSTDDGFSHIVDGQRDNMATYEACYALQWYLGFLENGGAGHPYYLYYHLFDFSSKFSTDANILSFSIDGKEGIITEGGENGNNTISIKLPKGMPLTNITPDIVLSDKATLIAPSLPVTFVEGVEQPFTVLAEDGKTAKTYFVTVTTSDILPSGSKLDPDSIVLETGSQRVIEILNKKVTQTSSGTDILLTIAHVIDTSNLRLIADISYGAVSDPTVDGSIILDLSDWTTFTVVSADSANTSVYRIKVQQRGKASIESFRLTIQGRVYAGVIDHDALTINVSGVDDNNLSSTVFVPDIGLGEDTIVCNPLPGIEQDFSVPVVYTVAGNDIESCSYTVSVTNLKGELIKASGGGSGGGNNYVDYTEVTNRLWRLVTENNTIVDHQVSYGRRLI